MNEQNKAGVGGIVGTIIIISIIVLGGLYFWGKRIEDAKRTQALVTDTSGESMEYNEANAIRTVSNSDDLGSIEADLKSTNLDDLNKEVDIQQE